MERLQVDRVYVIHVRSGAEDRAASIERQCAQLGIAFEYVLEGDVADLTPEVLDRWFDAKMKRQHPYTSCCYKHLLAYVRMIRDDCRDALVLEDDIFLSPDFVGDLHASLTELRSRADAHPDHALISLENSGLPRIREAVPGTTLYRRMTGREAGAYWLSRGAAERFVANAESQRIRDRNAVWHTNLIQAGELEMWWRHPAIAEQGSVNGRFDSFLDPNRRGFMRRPRWLARKAFQQYIRPFVDRLRGLGA